MPREKEDYRTILEDILTATGGKRMLTIEDVIRYTGLGRKTVKKRYMPEGGPINACVLARRMCP